MALSKDKTDISIITILKVAAVALALVFLYLVKDILIILFLAVIIASTVSLFANALEKKRIPRIAGVLLVYLAGIATLVLIFYFMIPPIIDEIKQLAVVLPDYYETFSKQIFKTTSVISPDYAKNTQEILFSFGEKIKELTSGVFNIVSILFGGVVSFVAIVVISFYLAIQKKGVEDFLRLVTPQDQEAYVLDVWHRVERKLGKWLEGQLILALIMGAAVFLGLTFIGLPYALLLGIIAGILEIVPMAGPILSALLGVSVAFLVSPFLALLTLIFYVIVQQTENHILVPLLMQKATGLNPVVVIVALLAGAKLGGVLGMLIAVPLATIAGELLEDFAQRKVSRNSQQ